MFANILHKVQSKEDQPCSSHPGLRVNIYIMQFSQSQSLKSFLNLKASSNYDKCHNPHRIKQCNTLFIQYALIAMSMNLKYQSRARP